MTNLHRAQILLDRQQHQALVELAAQSERSISDLVREIIGQHLDQRADQVRLRRELQAIEALTGLRKQIEMQHGLIEQNLLAEARSEREEELAQSWS